VASPARLSAPAAVLLDEIIGADPELVGEAGDRASWRGARRRS
jgi:hypothetical protein